MSYQFFQNSECEYFPCHKISKDRENDFNCLFCYCPLHHLDDCGGSFVILQNGWKDCTSCTKPHFEYDYIQTKLTENQKIYAAPDSCQGINEITI